MNAIAANATADSVKRAVRTALAGTPLAEADVTWAGSETRRKDTMYISVYAPNDSFMESQFQSILESKVIQVGRSKYFIKTVEVCDLVCQVDARILKTEKLAYCMLSRL